MFIFIRCISNSTNTKSKNGILFSLLSIIVAILGSGIQYSGAQDILPVSSEPGKIETPNLSPSTKDENGEEPKPQKEEPSGVGEGKPEVQGEEPTVKSDGKPEVQGEEPTVKSDGKPEVQGEEPTDEVDNDTVTSAPLKRPTGTDLGLKNLTVAPGEGPGKLIFASCIKYHVSWLSNRCDVAGAMPGDNVIVSSTPLDGDIYYLCHWIQSAEIPKPNIVIIYMQGCEDYEDVNNLPPDYVIFSIIVFRPGLDILKATERND
jgi:hypothetical protein